MQGIKSQLIITEPFSTQSSASIMRTSHIQGSLYIGRQSHYPSAEGKGEETLMQWITPVHLQIKLSTTLKISGLRKKPHKSGSAGEEWVVNTIPYQFT